MLKVAWSENYAHPLPVNHRFPMAKYKLLPEQLIYEGTLSQENFFTPDPLDEATLLAVHREEYWRKLQAGKLTRTEERKTGFPWSPQLVEREITIANGTVLCSLFALQHGVSMNIAGGTHHAFTDRGEGFCLLNDIAIGAQYLLDRQLAQRVLVVDLDVHQGNGTAQIFQEEPRVFTFSMHGGKNYPLQKEQSDLDVPLPDGIEDKAYLDLLAEHFYAIVGEFDPDFIYFQSGVDVLSSDKLGRLGLTREGCKERDRFILQWAQRQCVPLVAIMGGGYSERLSHIVEAHANTFRLAQEIYY
ncbi:MAG TPA: histone deacetylase [Cytophagales bacterium]|nr:histone deacetylase [Cytophagales bacterium]HAA24329.1 histone deacetylase [Cytophagales bacterium]HAP63986.1 histone deacetylase [Cytophagales bacterium]